MTNWVRKWLEDPRLWLAIGAVCFVISFILGYHQAQQAADQAIAMRSAPPPTVTIQNFDEIRETNGTREVRILAETDFEAPVAVNVTAADGALRAAVIYPLYPVSRAGRDAVLRAKGATPRPVPRPLLRSGRPPALGIAVHFAATPEEAAKAAEASFGAGLGGGRYGRVVQVNGSEVAPGNLEFVAQGAVAARGGTLAADFLSVKPFTTSRMEAVTPPRLSPAHGILTWAAVLSGFAAIFLSVRPHVPMPRRRRKSGHIADEPQSTGHKIFAPIATQDEIANAEEEARTRAYVSHPVVRILDTMLEETKSIVLSRLKSRQSPRAD